MFAAATRPLPPLCPCMAMKCGQRLLQTSGSPAVRQTVFSKQRCSFDMFVRLLFGTKQHPTNAGCWLCVYLRTVLFFILIQFFDAATKRPAIGFYKLDKLIQKFVIILRTINNAVDMDQCH